MALTFELPIVNPMRFVAEEETDLFLINQDGKCYFQKWQTDDSTILQVLSDFPDIEFHIRDYLTNAIILTITPDEIPVTIIGQTFKCYQIAIDFSQLQPGKYYAELKYSGLSDPEVVLLSEPFDVQTSWPGTLLFKYKNSENNFSIIFDTGLEFSLRVEGDIKDFSPASNDVIYNDQKVNSTLLMSVPFRTWKLFVGKEAGLPDWIIDKINRAMSCDQKQINGAYYERVEGAKWEIARETVYPFIGISIDIIPAENVFLQRLKTGDQPPEGYTIVEKVKNYFANAADIVVDIFIKYSLLKHISIINYGGAITLKVGTTDGGNEIGEFEVPVGSTGGEAWTETINWLFTAGTTIYLTGLTGSNADVMLDYLQYDATPAQPTPAPAANLGIGAVIRYEEAIPGQLTIDFSLSTGLGQVGTDWFGWALKDGRNGTTDEGGRVPVMWIDGDPIFGTLGATGGEDKHTLTQSELPAFDIPFVYDKVNRNGSGSQETMRNYPGSNDSQNIPFPGGGLAHNNMQPYIVALWVKKIA